MTWQLSLSNMQISSKLSQILERSVNSLFQRNNNSKEGAGGTAKNPVIALLGNPNTGKTTVFNALCGTRQKTGNFPGVTVEKKTGFLALSPGETEYSSSISGETSSPNAALVEVIDLPGLYSLKAGSPDEDVAADVAMGRVDGTNRPDAIVFILDATNLKRNLYLFSQVAEMKFPMVVALTMTDLLASRKIELDLPALEEALGVPVLPIVGRNQDQVSQLKKAIGEMLHTKRHPEIEIGFPPQLETIVDRLSKVLNLYIPVSHFEVREMLFFKDYLLLEHFFSFPDAMAAIESERRAVKDLGYDSTLIAFRRYRWADGKMSACEKRTEGESNRISQKIDAFLTHRFFGLIAFVGIMYLVFQSIYTYASPLMDLIEYLFDSLGTLAGSHLQSTPILRSLVVDGLISGVGSVVVFVPQIAVLFLFIAILEDSGYLARAAFLMDRLLSWSGLNGRAFIPMLSSFACAIPGVMATRIMPDPRARLTTTLIAPLMSCSARLPVYILFIGAFIEPYYGAGWAAFSLFAMHALGIIISLPIAFFINRGILRAPALPFLLEIPPYRLPQLFNVFYRVYEASRSFLLKAGSVIFALSIVIWFLSYFPHPPSVEKQVRQEYEEVENVYAPADPADIQRRINAAYLEQSVLGRAGKAISPLFQPLGFDWRISIGILSAFPAREVIVSTLGIIFSSGDESGESLKDHLRNAKHPDGSRLYTPLTAITLMVFFALSSQCMSTLAIVRKELNSWKWPLFLFTYMTLLAYGLALLVNTVGSHI